MEGTGEGWGVVGWGGVGLGGVSGVVEGWVGWHVEGTGEGRGVGWWGVWGWVGLGGVEWGAFLAEVWRGCGGGGVQSRGCKWAC